jgi:hypothetical protein
LSALAAVPQQAELREPAPGGAAGAVAGLAEELPAISLAAVLERAELQVRHDRKYLLTAEEFSDVARALAPGLEVLEIDRRREFAYESRYFDTPELQTFREHLHRRVDRFKVRTRSYLDSGRSMFEVKLAGPLGGTNKRRIAHPFADRGRITASARGHLDAVLRRSGRRAPQELAVTCVTAYRRTTFVARDGSARLTCDHDMEVWNGGLAQRALRGHVLVEVKSAAGSSFADRRLATHGIEPVSFSKYCAGLVMLRPELPAWPWKEALARCSEEGPPPVRTPRTEHERTVISGSFPAQR